VRAVIQRVSAASVSVDGTVVGAIGTGLCVLIGVTRGDDAATAHKMAEKLWGLRIFADQAAMMNLSVADVGGSLLVISQFTLYGDARRGRRPSFVEAAPGPVAEPLVDAVCATLRGLGAPVETGVFGADMAVEIHNDGPVTIILDLDAG